MRAKFGTKVYKVSLDGGMTCPNRDGTKGTRGCIFCGNRGGGEFAVKNVCGIRRQLDDAISVIGAKADGCGLIAYFQSFTNTYAPVERLRELFLPVINDERVVALSIGTRPDCLQDDVVELLSELNKIKPVWVELGLQTIHESTAKYIRRGYDLCVYDDGVKRLKERGIEVVTHVIIGLPYETKQMIVETARYAGAVSDGIKLHLLHVLKDSDLYDEYMADRVEPLTFETYADILTECIKNIPRNVVLHRITGDGDKKTLVAPLWSANKKRVLNDLHAHFKAVDLVQGCEV